VRDWVVGGGIIETAAGILMVHNRRRNGSSDWSTPGGVIDEGESVIEGLGREVNEETGLEVIEWIGPVYEIEAVAIDMEWRLRVEVHRAVAHSGDIRIDDPDGIVFDARFVPHEQLGEHLAGNQVWVSEPLLDYVAGRKMVEPYRYEITGQRGEDIVVTRR
jgi:8-oxo-dGTP diphosphatase